MPFRSILVVFIVAITAGVALYTNVSERPATPEVVRAPIDFATAAIQFSGFNKLSNAPPVPNVKMFDESGNVVTFEKFLGKVVVFNLWATWCPPCIREMPDLNGLQEDFAGRDFIVVPVASGRQGQESPADFLRKRNLTALTTYFDPQSLFMKMLGLETLPTTFVLDRKGIMRGGVLGLAEWRSDQAKVVIESLLNEKP